MIVAAFVIFVGLWIALDPVRVAMMLPSSDVIPSGDLVGTVSTYGWWIVAAGVLGLTISSIGEWYERP
jgi:hypothetical protein